MRAGRLNRRITLQAESIKKGAMGAGKRYYTDIATVWAAVEIEKGQEIFESQKRTAERLLRITIRYRKDIRENWRVRMQDPAGERLFAVESIVNPLDGRRELRLMCRELPSGEPV